eukprot:tig00000430_g587.t1
MNCSAPEDYVRFLLDAGADLNAPSYYGSPFTIACGGCRSAPPGGGPCMDVKPRPLEFIRYLLSRGGDPSFSVPGLGSALVCNIYSNPNTEICRLLLEAGADPRGCREGAPVGESEREAKWKRPVESALSMALHVPDMSDGRKPVPPEIPEMLLDRGATTVPGDLVAAGTLRLRTRVLELQVEEWGRPGAPRPAAERHEPSPYGKPGSIPELKGAAASFLTAAKAFGKDEAVQQLRACLDLVLHCDGKLHPSDLEENSRSRRKDLGGSLLEKDHRDPTAKSIVSEFRKVLEAEGRMEGAGGVPAGPEAALQAAARGGFRLACLRLAAAAQNVDAPDESGGTPLYHAVRHGPAMLDVCTALIQKGADAARVVGEGTARRMVVRAHPDVAFQAELKRAAGLRDAYISYVQEDLSFAKKLRDALEAHHVTCWDGSPLRRAQALLLLVSPASVGSRRCRAELGAARALGREVFPVWKAKAQLDDELQGALLMMQFADFSTDELFEQGLYAFALTLSQRVAGATGGEGAGSAEGAAAELASSPEARCDLDGPDPFVFVWCSPSDAEFGLRFVRGLRHRRVPCWAECPAPGVQRDENADARAAVRCAAFVPLLSPAAVADPALRGRLQLCEVNKRPVVPALLSDVQGPDDLLAGGPSFAFLARGNVALLANVEALLESLSLLGPPPASISPEEGRPASPGAGPVPAELEEARGRLEAARRHLAELSAQSPGAA